ncbi:MAG: CPBP family intramembrane glutamic endopeptidase [Nitrososphaerota archaeon]|nr:CPBP family intramembrane metalloprotease [Candidatus Calditenuaceae archaeon]MDW8073487.1 CPBP family intramembrane glutamic endopeptidase [Nitrososphaerota archaeon]
MAATRDRVLLFSILSLILAALVDVAFYLLGGLANPFAGLAWGALRMYTPTVSALLVGDSETLKRALRFSMKAFVYFLTSPLIAFAALLLYFAITAPMGFISLETLRTAMPVDLPPETLLALMLINSYIAAISINTLFALGEEIGWRGFLQVELEARGHSTAKAALLVGLVWGVWHATAILLLGHNYPENRLLGVALFTAFTVALSLPHAAVTRLSSSVLPAASLHGAINAIWALTILTSTLPRELGGLGPLGIASWAIVSIANYLALLRLKR